jgi:ABC-2 type transport system permease protein
MTRLFAAEMLKLRTIRGTWGYVLSALALAAIVTAGSIGSAREDERFGINFQPQIVRDATLVTITIALLLGVTLVTNEFRHGTITPSFLTTPRRGFFLSAKLLAAVATGLALVVASLVVIAAIAVVWLGFLDVPLQFGDAADPAARVLVAAAIAGAFGAALGGLVHAQVPALVGTLVWLFVAEPLLGGLLGLFNIDGVADYLPAAVLYGIPGHMAGSLSFLPAVLVGLAQVAVLTALAVLRTDRRDIT